VLRCRGIWGARLRIQTDQTGIADDERIHPRRDHAGKHAAGIFQIPVAGEGVERRVNPDA